MYTIDKENIDPSYPPEVRKFLEEGGKIEEINLSSEGVWTHENSEISNARLQRVFSRHLMKTEAGNWVIKMGTYTYPIVVEDTGFFVDSLVELTEGDGFVYSLSLSDGTEEDLDPATVRYQGEGTLYCKVKNGQFRAKFKRAAYYQFFEHCMEKDGQVVFICGDKNYVISES